MRALIALAPLLGGCAGLEATVIAGIRTNGDSNEIAVNLAVTKQVRGRVVLGYVHESEIFHGQPWNDADETHTDLLGAGMRFGRGR